ncbi:hypothetical protein EDC32_1011103 [Laceyella sacchari]|jgi:hypothetical protein|nr:hypothetical protein EDC32_1011103 [Laceyella sacchari]
MPQQICPICTQNKEDFKGFSAKVLHNFSNTCYVKRVITNTTCYCESHLLWNREPIK